MGDGMDPSQICLLEVPGVYNAIFHNRCASPISQVNRTSENSTTRRSNKQHNMKKGTHKRCGAAGIGIVDSCLRTVIISLFLCFVRCGAPRCFVVQG